MPHGALDVTMMGAEKLEPLLPDGTPELFSIYGALIQCSAIAATRNGDPYRARELLRGPASKAAQRVGDGKNYHHMFFGPTNVGIHAVAVEVESGDISDAVRLADTVDINKVASLERRCAFLYHVARAYDYKGNDTAVLVHLKMAEKLRPQDFLYKRDVRSMVSTLAKRARPSYAAEVREFASRIDLLN